MIKMSRTTAFFMVGTLGAAAMFAALSAGGLVTFSFDMGAARWIAEEVSYAFTNKLAEKLIASLAAGVLCGFIANMIVYGRSIRRKQSPVKEGILFRSSENNVGSKIA